MLKPLKPETPDQNKHARATYQLHQETSLGARLLAPGLNRRYRFIVCGGLNGNGPQNAFLGLVLWSAE